VVALWQLLDFKIICGFQMLFFQSFERNCQRQFIGESDENFTTRCTGDEIEAGSCIAEACSRRGSRVRQY
jgi:hypothetical protein